MKFATERELKNYVDSELSKALPSSWKVNYGLSWRGSYLEWRIVPPSEWIHKQGGLRGPIGNDYLLQVTQDFSTFIIIHGNHDGGPICLWHEIKNAKVVCSYTLYQYPLSEVISYIIDNYIPNSWGHT